MTTLERPHDEVLDTSSAVSDRPDRRSRMGLVVTFVAVIALVVGGAIGWFVRGGGDDAIVLSGDGDLTERQLDMVDFMDDYSAAWQRGDGEAVAAMYIDNGTFVTLGTEYRVDDGSLAAFVESGDWGSLDVLEPMLVHSNDVLNFHTFVGGFNYMSSFTFTGSGELLLINHTITD